ncbi:periplasmic binding protein-like II [Piromyces finnis]|uniref:Periplasmic binding protein-like II n=1 Tax=Piromyces finnis TaxID=1754191 RepID=A0A1Y1V173_9FUNG|nr:periplasmic binding protein-like II [Piromyces finnis]|eukprot:ORX45025.1 periplasmic binding protein-like II [Piromyces finnis]
MNLYFIYIFIFIIFNCICGINSVKIKAISYAYSERLNLLTPIVDEFNKYSKKQNLDIQIELTILAPENSTSSIDDYASIVGTLLARQSTKYDLIFYYASFSEVYGEHFVPLNGLISEEHINMFDKNIISKTCTWNKKVIGLPFTIELSVLYSNKKLLDKYGEKVPKTWDELIKTSKYIMEEEKKLNNTDIISYNGLFSEGDYGILSIYELITSFRKSNADLYPGIESDSAQNAIKMIKILKNEIGSDSQFLMEDDDTRERIISGKALFLKFWYYEHNPDYTTSNIPGEKAGISGSVAGGYNIAINRYSSAENQKAAIEALKFITSKDTQKKFVISKNIYSAINSLYDDEEACSLINCNIYKNAQPLPVLDFELKIDNIPLYIINFKKYIYEYVYNDADLSDVIKKIEDLTKYYHFSVIGGDSILGPIFFVIISIIVVIMSVSHVFIFHDKFKPQFEILSNWFWTLSLLGSIIMMCSVYTLYGDGSEFKCKIRIPIIYFGHAMSLIPVVYILIINFPEENKISNWFKNNKYIFTGIVVFIEFSLNFTLLFSPYHIEIFTYNGENFQKCVNYESFGAIFNFLSIFCIMGSIITISILLFVDWNVETLRNERRFITALIAVDIISIIVFNVFASIEIKSYLLYNIIFTINVILFSVTNYLLIYIKRVIIVLCKNKDEDFNEIEYIKKNRIFNNFDSSSLSKESKGSRETRGSFQSQSQTHRRASDISNALISYHYKVSNSNRISKITENKQLDL